MKPRESDVQPRDYANRLPALLRPERPREWSPGRIPVNPMCNPGNPKPPRTDAGLKGRRITAQGESLGFLGFLMENPWVSSRRIPGNQGESLGTLSRPISGNLQQIPDLG